MKNQNKRRNPAYYKKGIKTLSPYQRKILELTDRYIELFVWNYHNDMIEFRRKTFIRNLRNEIYDTGKIFTGQISIQAYLDWKQQNLTPCKEHFFNRARSSRELFEKIVEWNEKKITTNQLTEFMILCCSIHYTTPEENKMLEPIQNDESLSHLTPDEIYDKAGIVKIIKPSVTKKVLIVHGIYYNNIKEIAEHHYISQIEVNKMFKNKNIKTWIKESECDNFYRVNCKDKTYEEIIRSIRRSS